VAVEIRRRSFRVQILQNQLDGMLRRQRERAVMYSEQLGESHEVLVNRLKLEYRKRPVEILVVDRIERPSEN